MTIQELVYDYKRKLDKLDSQDYPDIPLPVIIRDLNEAQQKIVLTRYSPNNLYRQGFEGSQKRIDELSYLVVPDEQLSGAIKVADNIYSFNLENTQKDYLFLLRANFLVSTATCTDILLDGISSKTDNLNTILSSPFEKPSLSWRETPYRIADNKLRVYSDGEFKVTKAIIDYLRYPRKMDIVGYIDFDGTNSTNVECELPEFLQNDIVDAAVTLARLNLKDDVTAQQYRKTTEE